MEEIQFTIKKLEDYGLIKNTPSLVEKVCSEYILYKESKEIVTKKRKKIETFQIQSRRYLGAKTKLLEFIEEIIEENCKEYKTFFDVFSGTGVVAEAINRKGKKIIVNDLLSSNYHSYKTWFSNEKYSVRKLKKKIKEFNELSNVESNYFSDNYGGNFFTLENAKKIGYIRESIENLFEKNEINEREKSILITSLIYATDKVANTCGHYEAFRKKLDTTLKLTLKFPEINNKNNKNNLIFREDSNKLVKKIKTDIAYIDPPYNSRQYGDAYHLLDNIADWKKPPVEGIAKKMKNRQHLKSKYCLKSAPLAFEELIESLNAKYILVSYNNTGNKGAERSKAKISDDEMLRILKKKGNVKIYEFDYNNFSAGKSSNEFNENHKERIFFCKVNYKKLSEKKKFVNSPFNYTGGKYKLLPQINPYFPKEIRKFVDVFCGGGSISANVEAQEKIAIDINSYLIHLLNLFKENSEDEIINRISLIISQYNLSETSKYGYEHYGCNSSAGLSKYNKENYTKLRNKFNKRKNINCNSLLELYTLIIFGFNNQIRFNGKEQFNMPVGKRDFNKSIKQKIKNFSRAIKNSNINYVNKDFRKINLDNYGSNDFIYLDPPYLLGTASYNENGGWGETDEYDLLDFLDRVNSKRIKFALSNVIKHKGKINTILESWCIKNNYNINFLNYNYNNSNYQSKSKENETIEVLITNYKKRE